jgi:hypothetical protein
MELNLKLGSKPMMDGWMDDHGWMSMGIHPPHVDLSLPLFLSFFLSSFLYHPMWQNKTISNQPFSKKPSVAGFHHIYIYIY